MQKIINKRKTNQGIEPTYIEPSIDIPKRQCSLSSSRGNLPIKQSSSTIIILDSITYLTIPLLIISHYPNSNH